MWNIQLTLIIFLKIAIVLTSEDDKSDFWNADLLTENDYELMLFEATWYSANQYCVDHNMFFASIHSDEERQQLEMIIKNEEFWLSKSILAQSEPIPWKSSKNIPWLSNWEPNNKCFLWYWINVELCFALLPLANGWTYDECDKKKYFICEQIAQREKRLRSQTITESTKRYLLQPPHPFEKEFAKEKWSHLEEDKLSEWLQGRDEPETELIKLIENELTELLDEDLLLRVGQSLRSRELKASLRSLIEGGLLAWLGKQHKFVNVKSLLAEEVISLAEEGAYLTQMLETDELRKFIKKKFHEIRDDDSEDHRFELLLAERLTKLVGDEYMKLKESDETFSWEEYVSLIYEKLTRLAMVEKDKKAKFIMNILQKEAKPLKTFEEGFLTVLARNLIEKSEKEFEFYVKVVSKQLVKVGKKETEGYKLLDFYSLVKEELFSIAARAIIQHTSDERMDIAAIGLSQLLHVGVLQTETVSVFGKVFISIAVKYDIATLNDEHLQEIVKKEFKRLSNDDMVELKHYGYTKLIISHFITLTSDTKFDNESEGLSLENVTDLISKELLWNAFAEMNKIAQKFAKFREEETRKRLRIFRIMYQSENPDALMFKEDVEFDICRWVDQHLFEITLAELTKAEIVDDTEAGLLKILKEEIQPSLNKSKYWEVLMSLVEEITEDEGNKLSKEKLRTMVKWELEMMSGKEYRQLLEETFFILIADEYFKLTSNKASFAALETEKSPFQETLHQITRELLNTKG